MGRTHLPALATALLLAGLAGCADPQPAPTPADPDALDAAPPEATTGSLLVVVLTPDLHPIPDALVTADDREARTDDAGSARLEGLTPGTWFIDAAADGHRTARVRAEVQAGEEATLQVKLLPGDATAPTGPAGPANATEPYTQQFQLNGFFDCSATYLIITGDCLLLADFAVQSACAAANQTCPQPGDLTNEEFVLEFPLDAGWQTVVAEMHWEAGTTAGSKMTFAVEPAEAPADGHAAKYARAEGESPLVIRLDAGVPHESASLSADGEAPDMPQEAGGEVLRTRSYVQGEQHRPGGTQFLGVGAAVQQQFEVLVTVYYVEPAPTDA